MIYNLCYMIKEKNNNLNILKEEFKKKKLKCINKVILLTQKY